MVGHWVRPGRWLAVGIGVIAGACKLSGVFGAPGMKNVVLTYVGNSTLTVGDRVGLALAVTVEADGVRIPNPRLRVVSYNPSVIAVTPAGDSLVAVAIGQDTLSIQLVDAILVDSLPTIIQPLRVQGGPP